jgi:hypothetical protein
MAQIAQLVGPAGTGKTTELLRLMDAALEKDIHDPHLVGFVSFTRAARREAANRGADRYNLKPSELENSGWFRTLHSVAYRCLRCGKELLAGNKADCEWLTNSLQESVDARATSESDGSEPFSCNRTDAGRALALWDVARNRLEPYDDVWRRLDAIEDTTPDLDYCRRIVDRYERAKRLDNRCDFTDLLARFSGWRCTLDGSCKIDPEGDCPDLPIWLFDEQQDTGALLHSVCERLIEQPSVRYVYVAGDDGQCQPGDTMVLTDHGYTTLAELDEKQHKIVSYCFNENTLRVQGYSFRKASRTYLGRLLTIGAAGLHSRCTPNHKWQARWTPESQKTNAIYLMRKGVWWRVGWCQLFCKSKGIFHLGMRARIERADEAWILRTFDDRADASAYESIVAAKYGLTQAPFHQINGAELYTQETIDKIFSGLDADEQLERATRCLADHGRDGAYPIWKRSTWKKQGQKSSFEVQACNIIQGLMAVPKVIGKTIEWIPVDKVDEQEWAGVVYSMNVDPHHNYVADGLVTKNSIYGFSGASPQWFREGWSIAKRRVLDRSYRCPRNIMALGEGVLRDCYDAKYYSDRRVVGRDEDGVLEREQSPQCLVSMVDPRESWLILARTNQQAASLAKILDAADTPWLPTRGNCSWNAPVRNEAIGALMSLEAGAPIDGREWLSILKHIPAKLPDGALLEHGTKSRWVDADPEDMQDQYSWLETHDLPDLGATQLLIDHVHAGRWKSWIDGADRFSAAVSLWGLEAVTEPKVRVGSIHSVKGSEADNVVVLTTLPAICARNAQSNDGHDEEKRVLYVGITRARKRLVILDEHRTRYRWKVDV